MSKPAFNLRIWLALFGGFNRQIGFSCKQKDNKTKNKKKKEENYQGKNFEIWTDLRVDDGWCRCKHFLLFRFIAHYSTTLRYYGFDFLENEKQIGEKNNQAFLRK